MTKVQLGEHDVQVISGGLYDQYRMNPDLEKIRQIPDITCKDFSFFHANPKREVTTKIGPTWSPNYYYKMKSIQLVMLAPIQACRAKVDQKLEPLSPIPGYGLVAVTFYNYDVCDNDSYNEVSVAVICRQPGRTGPHFFEMIRSILSRRFYGYVIALPVTTEIARVRGKYGYDLPKWLMKIDLDIGKEEITLLASDTEGKNDISIRVPVPFSFKAISANSKIFNNTSLNKVDEKWTEIAVKLNPLSFAQSFLPRKVSFTYGSGPLSDLLKELKISTVLRMDVCKDAQMALFMPETSTVLNRARL